MHHPRLIAVLAQDRRRQCPCGAVADRPYSLCRKCQARVAWRRKAMRTRRRAARRAVARYGARFWADTLSLLQINSKGCDN
jgi:hypothetical protein